MAAVFLAAWVRQWRRADTGRWPTVAETAIGFFTNFFDTLGIGSFAPTTSAYKLRRLVADELIPGTMNIGDSPPVILQAFIFVSLIAVEPITLLVLMGAAVLGSWLGAGVVTRWPREKIRLGMGLGLLLACLMMLLKNLDELRGTPLVPGGDALGLPAPALALAAALIFVMGALVTLGIGLYAPCFIMVSLLGMDPRAAFPIMMGSCAFVMPAAGLRFLRSGRYEPGPALGLSLGGIPAVLIAAFIVKALPLVAVRWLVVGIVLYTSLLMLRSET
jgi:uncharacterized membrane protein YfcA